MDALKERVAALNALDARDRIGMGREIRCVAGGGRNARVVSYDRVIVRCRVNGRGVGEILRAAGAPEGGN